MHTKVSGADTNVSPLQPAMRILAGFAVGALLLAGTTRAASCAPAAEAQPRVEIRYLISGGDVYGPLANDGEERGGSYDARLTVDASGWRFAYDLRRSIYTTENVGPSSFTRFPVIGGGEAQVPFFDAVEATSELGVARRIGRGPLFGGVGYFLATTNYAFPHLSGLGLTLERPADPGRGVKGYASLAYYLVNGNAGMTNARFRVAKGDVGLAYALGRRSALVVGYANEIRQPVHLTGGLLLDRSLPYFGLTLHL